MISPTLPMMLSMDLVDPMDATEEIVLENNEYPEVLAWLPEVVLVDS